MHTARRARVRRLAVAMLAAAPALGSSAPADGIDTAALKQHVEFLASDALQGRGAGAEGLDAAARYIAARFADARLAPAGDDSTYDQRFEVTTGVQPHGENALRLDTTSLQLDTDWRPYGYSHTGSESTRVVFAGYGIVAPEYNYDDYAGLDVSGKIVLVLALEPGQNDSTSAFEGTVVTRHADLRSKAIHAREKGAAGMLVVIGPHTDSPDRLAALRADAGYHSTGILCAQVRREALGRAVPGLDLGDLQKQIDATGKPVRSTVEPVVAWTVNLQKQKTELRNIIGMIPGRDPHHAIVLGAHYDHLGLGDSGSLDPESRLPHNGADDNASGTAALIEIAGSFAGGDKPAVTLIFAAFSGEEIGLAGSNHYVKNPTYPLQFTSAMLNMDMIGRLRDRTLMVFGVESGAQFKTWLDSLNAAGPKFDLRMRGDGYGPSDQMSFFKQNVPVLHFFTGAHSEYHKPSDDAHLVNYDGLAEVAGFVAAVTRCVGQQAPTFVAANTPPPSTASDTGVGGFRSYLGTVPDYGQPEDLQGVLLSGVRAGAPAEKAGLRGGDVIVQIDGMQIRNIYDYVHVLQNRRPAETIQITVIREGERLTLPAVLAERP